VLSRDFAIQRARGIIAEIENLKDEDFPYDHSRLALDELEERVRLRLDLLLNVTADDELDDVNRICRESLEQNFKLLPLLGFIVRSTHVRNSFEIFWPLLRLARQVLGDDVKLILSSEWWFSPHVYRPASELPDYVLLGFPASESSNPLLIPLAGHEFGHTTWQRHSLREKYAGKIQDRLLDAADSRSKDYLDQFGSGPERRVLAIDNLYPALECALRQAEETFCDFFGVRLFGIAYLHAFAYLVTPGGTTRDANYPSLNVRIANLEKVARHMKFSPPASYSNWFRNDVNRFGVKDQFLVDLADEAATHIADELLNEALDIAHKASVPTCTQSRLDKVKKAFSILTPATGIGDLVSIFTAAWEMYYQKELWRDVVRKEAEDERESLRLSILNELVLKSIEIAEYEQRVQKVSHGS